ncbi:Uncharacterised protein [uncultured archaeon]|nr:Uncharacterised protein [uncultured archaeon]
MITIQFKLGIAMIIFGIILVIIRKPYSKFIAKCRTNFSIGGWIAKKGKYNKEFYDYDRKWRYATIFWLGILGIIAGIIMIIMSLLNLRILGL